MGKSERMISMSREVSIRREVSLGVCNRCHIKVLEVTDTDVSEVHKLSLHSTDTLQEWWVVPDNGLVWTKVDLENACLNDEYELLDFCRPQGFLHGKLTTGLAYEQMPRRTAREFMWDFSLPHVEDLGWVMSVVFGTRANMQKVYARGLRELSEV